MKKIIAFGICVLIVAACTPSKQVAAQYDQALNTEFESFSRVYTEYALSMNKRDSLNRIQPQIIEDYRVYACNQVLYSLDTINKMKSFENDDSYLSSLKNYINVMQKTMQEYDGPKIKLLMKDSSMTREDSAKIKELTQKTLMESDKAYLEFQRAQNNFRSKYLLKPAGE